MPSSQDPNPVSPEITQRIQFLLSRQLDGDLASDELSELAEIPQSESLDRYSASIRHVGQQLTSLPVKPVPLSFAAAIQQVILDDSAKALTPAFSGSSFRWAQRLVVPAAIAGCALGLVMMLRTGGVDDSNRVALEEIPAAANHESAPVSEVASANTVVSPNSAIHTDTTLAADLTRQEDLRPFLESDDWRIVVVHVNSKDRDDVMHDIEAIVAKNNMNFRTVVERDDAHENRFGVLLTSAGVDEEDFINSVVPQADAKSTDWNAQNVAESSRESLISRVQESLKTPTYSELHFGQVYVTLPKRSESVDVADQNLVAQSDASDKNAVPEPEAAKISASRSKAPANTSPEPRKPVLVVFEFTNPSNDHI